MEFCKQIHCWQWFSSCFPWWWFHVLREIKSFLETIGYEIHSKWLVINTLPQMNSEIKGKLVIPIFICLYITFHFRQSCFTKCFHSPPCKPDWVGRLFLFIKWMVSSFKKITQRCWGLVFPWVKMIYVLMLKQWRSLAHVSHSKDVRRCMCPH